MKNMKQWLALSLIAFLLQTTVSAQRFWQDISEAGIERRANTQNLDLKRQIIPTIYRTVKLDVAGIKAQLLEAPMRFSEAAENGKITISMPMPDGSFKQFLVAESPVMHEDLQSRFPQIRAFTGHGIEDPTAVLKCGFSPKGFHGMIMSARHNTVYIDNYAVNSPDYYVNYYKKDYPGIVGNEFKCHVDGQKAYDKGELAAAKVAGDCQLRTYRLALACTGEYATFHGGTVPLVLAEYNVSLVRVNGVYERDFTVNLELVPNTDEIIYLNASTDPFTDGSPGALINQVQNVCDAEIGSANYDIGHVYSTQGGGLAGLGVVCTSSKGRGVTGISSPVNDPFYIDYVAHEIGHQFGGNHTFNNSCGGNRNNSTAVEPGSGNTIMAYAGICPPNVQNNSNDHFSWISIDEIQANIQFGASSSCPEETAITNNAPTVDVASNSYNVPRSTPLVLEAIATDPDGNTLTYCWEQMDTEISTQSPLATNTNGPSFRSNSPVESPNRYLPNIDAIVAGTTPTWEVLPSVARDMNWRCTVRDIDDGIGCTDEADINLEFAANAGPFVVMAPNTNVTWNVGNAETVTWDVANTNIAPVNATNVDIYLSTDGGFTYPILLVENVPNDGSETVICPNNLTNTARVMVRGHGNIFFDISNQNFNIQEPVMPTFVLGASPQSQSACADESPQYTINLNSLVGFNEPVNLTATGLPTGATAAFTPNPVIPTGNATMTINDLAGAASGVYTITVNASSATINKDIEVTLDLTTAAPNAVALVTPGNGMTGYDASLMDLTWNSVANANNYFVEIATSPAFGLTTIESANVNGTGYTPQNLGLVTVYYWRVRASNNCGDGEDAAFFSFQTAAIDCDTYSAVDLPLDMPEEGGGDYLTYINLDNDNTITDIDVTVDISHTWVGDLSAILRAPDNTEVTLFDRPGVPASNDGCNGDDIEASFNDDAAMSATDFEDACGNNPAIGGTFQPTAALATLNGQVADGQWTLVVTDHFLGEDGGTINSWSLNICSDAGAPAAPNLIMNQTLTVATAQSGTVTNAFLQANSTGSADNQVVYVITANVMNGTLTLNGQPLAVGDQFTQADINNGVIVYQHNGSATATDSFDFDVLNNNAGWLSGQTFNINILQNSLSANATLTTDVLCANENNGQITVNASGGTGTLTYSINGVDFQNSNVFEGLSAGSYTITVMDTNGFTTMTNTIVTANPTPITNINTVNNNMITVNASGGTGALMYSLNGTNFQGSNIFNNVANGTYTMIVQDANGCQATSQAIVAVNTLIVSASITTAIPCNNEQNGIITANVNGGQGPYMYTLNNGTPQMSNVFMGLGAGTYTILVTDNEGFTATTNSVTLDNPDVITANTSVNDDDITVAANGGTGALMYSLDGTNFQASNVFMNQTNGVYIITVQDANGCQTTTEAIVAVNTLLVSAVETTEISCFGFSDGVLTVNVGGGQGPYTYSLNNGPTQMSNVFSGLSAGSYSVFVMDDQGFSATTNTLIIENPIALSANNSVNNTDITINASGGTGNYQYSIDNGMNYQTSNVFTGNANGSYTITVQDSNGCETTTQATVLVNTLVVSASTTNEVSCHNGNDGEVTISVSGGNPQYLYNINGGSFTTNNVFSGLAPGTYDFSVQDSDGFMVSTNQITLTNPTLVTGTAIVTDNTITITADGGTPGYTYSLDCNVYQPSNVFNDVPNGTYGICIQDALGCVMSTSATVLTNTMVVTATIVSNLGCANMNTGSITAAVSGGSPNYQYSINGIDFQADPTFTDLAAGLYTITVLDANGFMATTNEVEVTSPPALELVTNVTNSNITLFGSGGVGPYMFSINGVDFQTSNTFTDLDNGAYTGYVQDSNGCILAQEGLVVNAILNVQVAGNPISCFDAMDGEITVLAPEGGVAPYTYSLNGGDFQMSNVFTGLGPDNYTVVTMDMNGSTFTNEIELTAPPAINASATADGDDITVTADGGNGVLMYSVDGINFQESNIFENLSIDEYTITVQDESGCTTTTTVNVMTNVNDLNFDLTFLVKPNPNNGVFVLDINQSTSTELQIDIFDITGKRVYAQSHAKFGTAFSHTFDVNHLAAGVYQLKVTDGYLFGVKQLVIVR